MAQTHGWKEVIEVWGADDTFQTGIMGSHFLPDVETDVFGVEYDGEQLMKFRLEIPVLGW